MPRQLHRVRVSLLGVRLCALQAERRLQEEVERVRSYLDESTEPKITKVAEQELIAEQVSPEGRAAFRGDNVNTSHHGAGMLVADGPT